MLMQSLIPSSDDVILYSNLEKAYKRFTDNVWEEYVLVSAERDLYKQLAITSLIVNAIFLVLSVIVVLHG